MKTTLLSIALICLSVTIFAQDKIILKNGRRFDDCKITGEDSIHYYFKYRAYGTIVSTFTEKSSVESVIYKHRNQEPETISGIPEDKFDALSLGLGIGFDYGGFGGHLMMYPQQNLGLFAGVGYALVGAGYNVGVKLRFVKNKYLNPYLTAMYGYQTAIKISNTSQFDKLYYGYTIGAGTDFRYHQKGYFSLGLLIPIRNSEAQDYIDYLKSHYGATFNSPLMPIGISIGYHFVLK